MNLQVLTQPHIVAVSEFHGRSYAFAVAAQNLQSHLP